MFVCVYAHTCATVAPDCVHIAYVYVPVYVHVCVRVHVLVNACVYVHVYMYVYVCVYVCVSARMRLDCLPGAVEDIATCVHQYNHIYICIFVCVFTHIHTYIKLYIYRDICIYIYIHIYIYLHTYIYTYIHMHTYICICRQRSVWAVGQMLLKTCEYIYTVCNEATGQYVRRCWRLPTTYIHITKRFRILFMYM